VGRSLFEAGRPDDARPWLERAHAIRAQGERDPVRRAETAFALAQAMWHSRAERSKAHALAIEARRDLSGSTDKEALAGVERWLHDHDAL
jgi:hypothetical protein